MSEGEEGMGSVSGGVERVSDGRQEWVRRLGVYVITDERADLADLLRVLAAAARGGATAVQLRRKAASGREFVAYARALRDWTRGAGVLFFVNDRVDVAQIVDADGVHVGQDDIACADARRLLGNRLIGVSAETTAEAKQAERDGADYLGVGAVYATKSKADAGRAGLVGLEEIVRSVRIPVVGIGGVTAANAGPVLKAGAVGLAVISAVMDVPDPEDAARRLSSHFSRR